MTIANGVQKNTLPSRFIGLGTKPDVDLAAAVMQIGFTQVPVIEYVTWTTNVPLTDAEILSTFGNEIDVLQNPKTVIGIDSVDSSFVQNGTLQVDMLVQGFGVHLFGEPLSFSQIGNSLQPAPATATAPPGSPDVFTLNDVQALGLPAASAMNPAILEWGVADWEALWHMANAYQFQWIMQQRYQLIQELVADVCYFGPYAEAAASGTSEVPIQPYVRQANNRYRAKAAGGIFMPVNYRRVGSVTTAGGLPVGAAGNVGVFHPTRDFDLAPTTWGGISNQGRAANTPFRKLIRPALLEKGLPIGMLLRVQDEFHQLQMQKFLSLSESTAGNLATVSMDANVGGIVNAAALIMPELTLDQGANAFSNERVNTDRVIYKGGTLKLSILIKGFELWGPWKEYLMANYSQGLTIPSIGGGGVGMLPVAGR